MCAKGALSRVGERRHMRYHLAIPLRQVPPVTIGEDGAVQSSWYARRGTELVRHE